jgi:hypothetical protein
MKKKVGIRAVQEINSARDYYEAHEAWVITNNFFSTQAIQLANSTNVILIDRDELVNLILNSNPAFFIKMYVSDLYIYFFNAGGFILITKSISLNLRIIFNEYYNYLSLYAFTLDMKKGSY